MNTPLMELIEWIDKKLTMSDGCLPADVAYIKEKATELLEKEREIIEKAYVAGGLVGVSIGLANGSESSFTGSSDYYTKTFTNESK